MSESSWVLKGVDAAIREKAVAEAERLGVSLGDFLTDTVLRSAIADQIGALAEAEPAPADSNESAIFAPPPESPEGFAVRHRLKTLERRLGSAVGSLDGALHALDSSVFDITSRVGDVEALAGDTAHALGQTQQEVNNTITGVPIHLAVIEDNMTALAHVQDERATGIDQRIDGVEGVARGAERAVSVLADAHEALKHAVADDFSAFAHDTTSRLGAGLAEVRAAADEATEQADAAVAHLISELRSVRAALDARLEESAEETRAHMHEAFGEAAERMAAMAERVVDNERFTTRVTDQLRAQIVDVEDGAQTALEETAESLRRANNSLAADLSRTRQESEAALESTRATLAAEIVAAREDQLSQLARLKLVDVAVGNTINELGDARETFDARIRETTAAASERAAQSEEDIQHLRQTLAVEVERVETCTLAALEKLAGDIAAGDANSERRIQQAEHSLRAELDRAREHAAGDINLLREEHAGALARLTLLDNALTRVEANTAPLEQRLGQLEAVFEAAETQQSLDALIQRFDALSGDTGLADEVAALHARAQQHETKSAEIDDRLQGVARMLNRVAAQGVESAARTEESAHQIEVALADLRLERFAEPSAPTEAIEAIDQRVAAFEQRQAAALDQLRAEIAGFVTENGRRLTAIEQARTEPKADDGDLATAFEDLRARIEERIIGVEQRSVRTLEQVVDTVAMIEQRLMSAGNDLPDQQAETA
jgi:hypothetical protein